MSWVHTKDVCQHTKLGGAIDPHKGRQSLLRDCDRLVWWKITNHVTFNKSKCWIVHVAWCYPGCIARAREKSADLQEEICRSSLSVSQHGLVAKRAKLRSVNNIANQLKEVPTSHSALVHPYLEYCVQFCASQYKGIKILECVQIRATMIDGYMV